MTNQDFRFKTQPVIVVGSGIAGLLLSIELAESGCKVKLVTKGTLDQSNSSWAQGGLAAVTGVNGADSKEQHLLDTIAAGDGLTDPVVAEHITADGARLVHRLAKHGVKFDPSSLALEGGHRMARVLHTADSTGKTIIDALIKTATSNPNIEVIEHWPLMKPTRAAAIGPLKGRPDKVSAAEAATIATTSGSFSRSWESTCATTSTSFLKPSAKSGRMGRSIRREIRVSRSVGARSRLK